MRDGREVWEERIKAQRESGLTRSEWCEREGVSKDTMQGWVGRLGMQKRRSQNKRQRTFARAVTPEASECVIVPFAPASTMPQMDLTIIHASIPAGMEPETFGKLLREISGQ
jgi:hypothetical protein